MALVSVMSAKGAPGATTTALLLANLWPTPSLVVDADPMGGDMALRLTGESGPLDPDQGLLSLLPSARRGLEPHAVLSHTQTVLGGQQLLAGLPGPEQAAAATPLWNSLAAAFARVPGYDVFVDVGQMHSKAAHLPVVENSSALVCVFSPTAWSALHTRRRLEAMESTFRDRGTFVGIVCVAPHNKTRDAEAAANAIRDGFNWITDLGIIAHDPRTVVIYNGGSTYRPERSLLARSGRAVVERLGAEVSPRPQDSSQGATSSSTKDKKQDGKRRRASRVGRKAADGAAQPSVDVEESAS